MQPNDARSPARRRIVRQQNSADRRVPLTGGLGALQVHSVGSGASTGQCPQVA